LSGVRGLRYAENLQPKTRLTEPSGWLRRTIGRVCRSKNLTAKLDRNPVSSFWRVLFTLSAKCLRTRIAAPPPLISIRSPCPSNWLDKRLGRKPLCKIRRTTTLQHCGTRRLGVIARYEYDRKRHTPLAQPPPQLNPGTIIESVKVRPLLKRFDRIEGADVEAILSQQAINSSEYSGIIIDNDIRLAPLARRSALRNGPSKVEKTSYGDSPNSVRCFELGWTATAAFFSTSTRQAQHAPTSVVAGNQLACA
jgi:hypothetical protein